MNTDVELVADPPIGAWHRHTWHSHGDRWACACGAWVRELRRADRTILAAEGACRDRRARRRERKNCVSEHHGRWWIAYSWYVAACVFCAAGGFVAGWLAR